VRRVNGEGICRTDGTLNDWYDAGSFVKNTWRSGEYWSFTDGKYVNLTLEPYLYQMLHWMTCKKCGAKIRSMTYDNIRFSANGGDNVEMTGTIQEHTCQTCKGEIVACNEHKIFGAHKYCLHTSDDANHKWHYTRAE